MTSLELNEIVTLKNPIIIIVKIVNDIPLTIGDILYYKDVRLGQLVDFEETENEFFAIEIGSNVRFQEYYTTLHVDNETKLTFKEVN
jgi:hypothetical protein